MKKQKIKADKPIKSGWLQTRCANVFCKNTIDQGAFTLIQFGEEVTLTICLPCKDKIKDFFGETI